MGLLLGSASQIEWPAQNAWAGVISSVRNRNGFGTLSAGRGFGAGGADGADGRHAYSQFNVGTQTGTTPSIDHITSRSNSGAGTVRDIWTDTVPRIGVFDLGGRFPLDTTSMNCDGGDFWLAGQSADSQVLIDMTTSDKSIRIRRGNVFIQHCIIWCSALPLFPGMDAGNNDNALKVDGNGTARSNLVLDHCMLGGGTDQVMSFISDFDNITMVDSMVCCPRGKDPEESVAANFHQFNMSIAGNSANEDADFVSLIGCVFVDGDLRNPQAEIEHAAFVNNLVYNRDGLGLTLRGKTTEDMAHKLNVIGCWDRRGADFGGNAHVLSIGRGDATQDFGTNTELHVDDCVDDVTTITDEWDIVDDANSQEVAVRENSIVSVAMPTGLVAAPMRSLSVADRLTLILQNNGPRSNARVSDVQAIYDKIIAGTGIRETDYAAPTVSDTSSAYVEPGSPHTEGVEAGRSVIEEDLLDKDEAFRV